MRQNLLKSSVRQTNYKTKQQNSEHQLCLFAEVCVIIFTFVDALTEDFIAVAFGKISLRSGAVGLMTICVLSDKMKWTSLHYWKIILLRQYSTLAHGGTGCDWALAASWAAFGFNELPLNAPQLHCLSAADLDWTHVTASKMGDELGDEWWIHEAHSGTSAALTRVFGLVLCSWHTRAGRLRFYRLQLDVCLQWRTSASYQLANFRLTFSYLACSVSWPGSILWTAQSFTETKVVLRCVYICLVLVEKVSQSLWVVLSLWHVNTCVLWLQPSVQLKVGGGRVPLCPKLRLVSETFSFIFRGNV